MSILDMIRKMAIAFGTRHTSGAYLPWSQSDLRLAQCWGYILCL